MGMQNKELMQKGDSTAQLHLPVLVLPVRVESLMLEGGTRLGSRGSTLAAASLLPISTGFTGADSH